MSEAPIARTVQLAPIDERERAFTIDVLRGVAVLGIFIVNILFMAFPFKEVEDWSWQALGPADGAARAFILFFGEMKFITLFSLLFGMGLAMQQQRADDRQRPVGGVYLRRLFILLAIGLAHGFLLWYGDILATYALLGFIAYACRNVRTKRLIRIAVILLLVPMMFLGGCVVLSPQSLDSRSTSWEQLAEQARRDAARTLRPAPTTAPDAGTTEPETLPAEVDDDPMVRFFEWMARERQIYQKGTWSEIAAHRAVTYSFVLLFINLMFFSWRCLALFLIGICVIRAGILLDRPGDAPLYRRMIAIGLGMGIALQSIALWTHFDEARDIGLLFLGMICVYLGSLGLSAAYAGGIALACLRDAWRPRLKPFAAVGRLALTNYLMHSIIAALLFHSYGLGLFGRVTYWQALLIVFAVFALQLLCSSLWLRAFRYGPAEWLWRCATYGRREPLLR